VPDGFICFENEDNYNYAKEEEKILRKKQNDL
jgi:hypothetical protein